MQVGGLFLERKDEPHHKNNAGLSCRMHHFKIVVYVKVCIYLKGTVKCLSLNLFISDFLPHKLYFGGG